MEPRSTTSSERAFAVPPGPSILDKLWAELMQQTGKLLALRQEGGLAGMDIGPQEGHCLGLAKAIAIVLKPYDPDVNEVRREVVRRLKEKK